VGPGMYQVTFTPTADTHYMAHASFRLGGRDLEDMRHIVSASGLVVKPKLALDLEAKVVRGLRVALTPPAEIRVNERALFRIKVEDPSSGRAVRDLQSLRGAGADVVTASADLRSLMHMDALPGVPRQGNMSQVPAPTLPFGPTLGFTQTFGEPGLHKVWVQIKHDGQVLTAPFTVQVK
ncbi:MAG: hypothetical protein ACM30E_06365, partial [Nitrososphaerales archaeon]